MRKSKLDSPPIKEKVIKRLAVGESQESIARDVGLNQSQVSRFANREEIKEFIEQEQMRLFEVIPDAVQNLINLVRMPNPLEKDAARLKIHLEAIIKVLQSAGMLPSQVQSLVMTNIFHGEIHTIHPVVELVVGKYPESLQIKNDFDEDPTDLEKKD